MSSDIDAPPSPLIPPLRFAQGRDDPGGYAVNQTLMGGSDGSEPEVRAVDLDGDGKPEVIVSFLLDRGTDTAIDRIRDTALETIRPMSTNGGPLLVYPTLVDLGGTGVIDLVDTTFTGPRSDPPYDHYVLRDGK